MSDLRRLQELADRGVFNARAVLEIRKRQAAGLSRQMTPDEIADMMREDAKDPKAALNRRRARAGLPPL